MAVTFNRLALVKAAKNMKMNIVHILRSMIIVSQHGMTNEIVGLGGQVGIASLYIPRGSTNTKFILCYDFTLGT